MLQQQCSVDVHVRNVVARVTVGGELDMATTPLLVDRLTHLERTDIEAVIVDLRDLTFLDCSALHAFLTARAHAEQNGHLLILIGARTSARRLFELTGTEFLLEAEAATGVIARFTGRGAHATDEASSFDVDADA